MTVAVHFRASRLRRAVLSSYGCDVLAFVNLDFGPDAGILILNGSSQRYWKSQNKMIDAEHEIFTKRQLIGEKKITGSESVLNRTPATLVSALSPASHVGPRFPIEVASAVVKSAGNRHEDLAGNAHATATRTNKYGVDLGLSVLRSKQKKYGKQKMYLCTTNAACFDGIGTVYAVGWAGISTPFIRSDFWQLMFMAAETRSSGSLQYRVRITMVIGFSCLTGFKFQQD
ncbi:hypothetical protein C8R44DRAFT_754006 [Mycena epipterygia]|nr:hypothetical protein C8R44DRAFT_754006 [Mycena epipterygia]